jgi:CO/xanthine dehydrogenase Mo-binding subunit
VSLVVGSVDIGGQRAGLAMQFAEAMGIAYEDVKPQVVNTDSIGFTHVTGGSRTTFATGWAVYEAAMDLRRKLEERAATIWEADREAVHYGDDGVIRGPAGEDGKERSLTFRELAGQLPHTGGMLQGRADVVKSGVGPAFGCHVVDVEVDPETGKVQVLRYTAVQDVGKAIHPSYVEGQIQGGASQGAGMALSEEYVYNAEGRMVNASLLDYRMPTMLDLPRMECVILETPADDGPFGVRGVGEPPIIPPAAALSNAVYDAIGARITQLPMSPERVFWAMRDRQG